MSTSSWNNVTAKFTWSQRLLLDLPIHPTPCELATTVCSLQSLLINNHGKILRRMESQQKAGEILNNFCEFKMVFRWMKKMPSALSLSTLRGEIAIVLQFSYHHNTPVVALYMNGFAVNKTELFSCTVSSKLLYIVIYSAGCNRCKTLI